MTGGWEKILKNFIIHFTTFLTHKKNSLPDLAHGFRDTPSKLRTNRPKICLILGSTSGFIVFAKSGGGGQKIVFLVLLFNVTTEGP